MKEFLLENEEAVRLAGKILAEIGEALADGDVDEAMARFDEVRGTHTEWDELEGAVQDIEGVIEDKDGILEVAKAVGVIVGTVVGAAIKAGIG